jgi:hypothetical protein
MGATVYFLPTARHDCSAWAADAHGVLDAVEELLACGDTSDVVAFCELAVAYLEANASEIDDPTPLVRLARRLGDLERRATMNRHPSIG